MDDPSIDTVLTDPVRRALYRLIVAADAPVSRNEAAEALGLPKSTVAFHLERMARDGALLVTTRKTGERAGPGSGRPTTFYAPAAREVTLSVPPRQYELMGDILAGALDTGLDPESELGRLLRDEARRRGRELGESAGATVVALQENGFEPQIHGHCIELGNCPFHRLARRHTHVVCALNGALLEGVIDGAGEVGATVHASPEGSPCCAVIRRGQTGAERGPADA
jgi:predicted ArsR family transcriptional regulator